MKTITLAATDDRECFAQNTHRVVLREETAGEFIGWPDPNSPPNSEHWKPGVDKPLLYPKFAWKQIPI